MARSAAGRVGILAFGAILLLLAWRLRVLESTHPARPHVPASPSTAASRGAEPRDLGWDEQQGGHTLTRHVSRSTQELTHRLASEGGIAAASTFVDRATAEAVVGETLAREERRVAGWMRRDGENLTLAYRGPAGRTIGWVLLRGDARPVAATDARIVLRRRGERYFVLTSYPVEP